MRDRDHQLGCAVLRLPVAAGTIAVDQGWSLTQILGAFTVAQLVAGTPASGSDGTSTRRPPRAHDAGQSGRRRAMVGVASGSLSRSTSPGPSRVRRCRPPCTHPPSPPSPGGPVATPSRCPCPHRCHARGRTRLDRVRTPHRLAARPARLAGTYPFSPASSPRPRSRTGAGSEPWPGRRHAETTRQDHAHRRGDPPFRRADFWLLVAGMALAGFAVSAVVVNLVPLLTEHGLDCPHSSHRLGVGGIGQVAGRLFYGRRNAVTGPAARAWITLGWWP